MARAWIVRLRAGTKTYAPTKIPYHVAISPMPTNRIRLRRALPQLAVLIDILKREGKWGFRRGKPRLSLALRDGTPQSLVVDHAFGQLSQLLIGLFLFLQSLFEQRCRFAKTQDVGKRTS
jgi:hypothetical protein